MDKVKVETVRALGYDSIIKVETEGFKKIALETENGVYVTIGGKTFYFDNSTGENIVEYWNVGDDPENDENVTTISEMIFPPKKETA